MVSAFPVGSGRSYFRGDPVKFREISMYHVQVSANYFAHYFRRFQLVLVSLLIKRKQTCVPDLLACTSEYGIMQTCIYVSGPTFKVYRYV